MIHTTLKLSMRVASRAVCLRWQKGINSVVNTRIYRHHARQWYGAKDRTGRLQCAIFESAWSRTIPASCQLVLDYLNRYQQENGEQFTVSVFDDGARIVEKYTPVYDILLLDIEMSEMDGMAAARRIRERDDKVVIVFITAAPQYAISGYEVRALSYLLKPLPWFAFSQELKKSIDMVRRNGDDSMLIETGNGQMRLNLADILYLESIRHTIVIHTLDGKYSINGTLKDMEAKLADHHFFRSNSCYLVNLKHVTGVADQDCIMSNGEQLRVSRPRKKAFMAALTDYMGGGR